MKRNPRAHTWIRRYFMRQDNFMLWCMWLVFWVTAAATALGWVLWLVRELR